MAATPSTMLALGTQAPAFTLPDTVSGSTVSLEDLPVEKGLLVFFICNHCPYVKHIIDELTAVANAYQQKGINAVAISSNDVRNYPDDSPEKMTFWAAEWGFDFPYLYDESQEVARAYQAACTPDFFLFDDSSKLVYRGQFDGSRPGNGVPVSGSDLREAMDALINENEISQQQTPSIGCNIKWK